jgi:membrane-anchored protein YejM (alkaline phosphatase superfamily)
MNKFLNFLIGLGIPLGLSTLWFGVVRKLVSPQTAQVLYRSSPMIYISPAILCLVALGVAAMTWEKHRYAAYGALLMVVIAVFIGLLIGRQHAVT